MSLTAIDLFAGAGGLSEGFRQAGFSILAANDFDEHAAETFKRTHPDTTFLDGPIQDITADDILDAAGIKRGELDCLIGGPPCQAFSVYNHQRGMHDERSGLFKEYLRIVQGVLPRWVVMENVTGMTSIAKGKAVQDIQHGLSNLGYGQFQYKILRAEQFGVPQERRRIFFVANRIGSDIPWPIPSHNGADVDFISVDQAISDLPSLNNGEGSEAGLPYRVNKSLATGYQKQMRNGKRKVFNHVAPKLSNVNMERMEYIPQGGSWRDIPYRLLPAGMKRAKRSDHTKRYGRLLPEGLSSTILTKCDIHWGTYIHPHQDRIITVREAARLQSFPDHFVFSGPRTEQYRQVGNAVPPFLARAVAKAIVACERGDEELYIIEKDSSCNTIHLTL